MPNTKSPIKSPPLRNPGQSLEKEILDVAFNEILEKGTIVFIVPTLQRGNVVGDAPASSIKNKNYQGKIN